MSDGGDITVRCPTCAEGDREQPTPLRVLRQEMREKGCEPDFEGKLPACSEKCPSFRESKIGGDFPYVDDCLRGGLVWGTRLGLQCRPFSEAMQQALDLDGSWVRAETVAEGIAAEPEPIAGLVLGEGICMSGLPGGGYRFDYAPGGDIAEAVKVEREFLRSRVYAALVDSDLSHGFKWDIMRAVFGPDFRDPKAVAVFLDAIESGETA